MEKGIKGLSEAEVKKSFELYGDNSLHKERKKGFFSRFFENLFDPIIKILMIALVLQVIFSFRDINYFEIGGILVAILLSTVVSTASEYGSEKAFEKLNSEALSANVSVLRDGSIKVIPSCNLVVGDIVYLSVGEKIQADGEIISGQINVDQSALNGESREYVKCAGSGGGWDLGQKNKVFRGSIISYGSAIMRVGRIGAQTYYGMVAKDVQTDTRQSPLKLRLNKLARQISKIGYVVAIIVGLSYLFNGIFAKNSFDMTKIVELLSKPAEIFDLCIHALTLMTTVVVVAAPEGLPMMITVVLSANMNRMLADNILVKKLVGIETAGSMNILFTDKTGTITYGRPQCEKIITVNGSYKKIASLKKNKHIYEILNLSAHYNTDVVSIGNEITGGNATDRAIYEYFANEEIKKVKIVEKMPFTSDSKMSSVTLESGKILTKGAAEMILASSKYAYDEFGRKVRFDGSNVYKEYLDAVGHGLRVVGIGVNEDKNDDMIFVGLIVMKDKIRPDVFKAVDTVKRAGIQIVMITGDGKETAIAIAKECGIYNINAGHIAISSEELNKMTDGEIKDVLPKIRVISRALPQDKTRLVRLSQELDLVVGMTGDGINDAPSIKLADVGFAMGSGTDIAKSASDILIIDNSFSAISKTVLYGRTIFKSIRKFITFQLTMNLVACGVSLLGGFIGVETPITIIQMLWINIIMDTLGGLAFAGEAPLDYYMNEKPKKRDEGILSGEMLNQILFTGAYTLLMCVVFLSSQTIRLMYGGLTPTYKFYTAFYALFIFSGLFNCFSARCSRLWLLSNIGKNKLFIVIMLLISVVQYCMIYFGGHLFRCVPLAFHELSFVILLSATVIPFEMLRRFIYKLK